MNLAEQIEGLRQEMVDAHKRETDAAEKLSAAMHAGDMALIDGLNTIIADQNKRRGEIASLVHVLMQRVGLAPPPQVVSADQSPLPRILRTEGHQAQIGVAGEVALPAYVPPPQRQPSLPPHVRKAVLQ